MAWLSDGGDTLFSASKMPAFRRPARESANIVHPTWSSDGTNRHMFGSALIFVSLLIGFSTVVRADVNRLTDQDELFERLVAPMKSVVDGFLFQVVVFASKSVPSRQSISSIFQRTWKGTLLIVMVPTRLSSIGYQCLVLDRYLAWLEQMVSESLPL